MLTDLQCDFFDQILCKLTTDTFKKFLKNVAEQNDHKCAAFIMYSLITFNNMLEICCYPSQFLFIKFVENFEALVRVVTP